jgi:hypothetical protein
VRSTGLDPVLASISVVTSACDSLASVVPSSVSSFGDGFLDFLRTGTAPGCLLSTRMLSEDTGTSSGNSVLSAPLAPDFFFSPART